MSNCPIKVKDVFCCFVSTGHLDVVALLVNHGAEVTCKDKKGYTPLHAAASNGQISVVKHLLNLGVEVSYDSGITPWCICGFSVVRKLNPVCILSQEGKKKNNPHFLPSCLF